MRSGGHNGSRKRWFTPPALSKTMQSNARKPNRRRTTMKTIILATLLALSAVTTGTAPAFADGSLSVHGNFGGNSYGR